MTFLVTLVDRKRGTDPQVGPLDHDVDPKSDFFDPKSDYLILEVGLVDLEVGLLDHEKHLYLKTHNTQHTLIMCR